MVNKQCGICRRYFRGELDGTYTCPDCLHSGTAPLRPLSSLDGLDSGIDAVSLPSASDPAARKGPDCHCEAKGHAA